MAALFCTRLFTFFFFFNGTHLFVCEAQNPPSEEVQQNNEPQFRVSKKQNDVKPSAANIELPSPPLNFEHDNLSPLQPAQQNPFPFLRFVLHVTRHGYAKKKKKNEDYFWPKLLAPHRRRSRSSRQHYFTPIPKWQNANEHFLFSNSFSFSCT